MFKVLNYIQKNIFKNIYTLYIMAKNKKLFTLKNKNKKINMEVNEQNYNHFQSLSPMQQKAVQDLMTLKFLQEMNNSLFISTS
jgi:hypothetical protein